MNEFPQEKERLMSYLEHLYWMAGVKIATGRFKLSQVDKRDEAYRELSRFIDKRL